MLKILDLYHEGICFSPMIDIMAHTRHVERHRLYGQKNSSNRKCTYNIMLNSELSQIILIM